MSATSKPEELKSDQSEATDAALAEVYLKLFLSTFDKQFDYGKWVLASLLAVHAGSILAISQAGEARAHLFKACGPYLIWGIAVTLVAGGFAWINFTCALWGYNRYHFSLREGNGLPRLRAVEWAVNLTLWAAPIVTIVSLVLFFIAAWKALQVL